MMRNLIRFLTLSLFTLILSSCRLPEIKDETPAVNGLKTETKFRVNLPEDHRTGYTWHLNDEYNKNLIERLNEVWHGNEKGLDYNFKTHASGQTTLTFVQRKFKDTLDIKMYIVKIGDY